MRSFNKYLFIPALTLLHIYLENSLRRPMQGTFICTDKGLETERRKYLEIFGQVEPYQFWVQFSILWARQKKLLINIQHLVSTYCVSKSSSQTLHVLTLNSQIHPVR